MTFMKDREADLASAPAKVESESKLDAFSENGRASILALLVTLGDNKYKLGRRFSEWATSGPTLEASVAAASMTSDEVGHARSLYPLLKRFPDAPKELRKEDDRTDFRNVLFLDQPFAHWSDFIAAAALFDKALCTLVESLRGSSYSPFRHRAEKILQEEQYHRLYADGWLETLAADDSSREQLRNSMNRIWLETVTWFGPDDDPVTKHALEEKILDASSATLRERFVADVQRTVEPIAGMGFPDTNSLPWDRWDPDNRRLRSE